MDYQFINEKILQLYTECNITKFPIDCFAILQYYNFRLLTYLEIKDSNPELHKMAKQFSDDAFRYKRIICYNDSVTNGRIRFSLMHELGHYLLGHKSSSIENEREADYFASCALAPRIAIQRSGCQTADAIHDTFGLSFAASNRVLADMRKWNYQQWYESEKALEAFLYPPDAAKQSASGSTSKPEKNRHPGKWAKIKAKNKFIEECYGSTTDFALEQYEKSLHLGHSIFTPL